MRRPHNNLPSKGRFLQEALTQTVSYASGNDSGTPGGNAAGGLPVW